MFMADQIVPKANISQMEADIAKQEEIDTIESQENKKKELLDKKGKESKKKKRRLNTFAGNLKFIKDLFRKKQPGPMGVTDVEKGKIRLNIAPEYKNFLWMVLECLIIGFLLNIMMHNFSFRIGIINIFGWSIFWWLLKFKMPDIKRSYK